MDQSLMQSLESYWKGEEIRFTQPELAQLRELHRQSGSEAIFTIWLMEELREAWER